VVGVPIAANVGRELIMWAAISESESITRVLLNHGAYVQAITNVGGTALHRAVEGNNEKVIRVLLESCAERNVPNRDRTATPLSIATRKGVERIMRILLEAGAFLDVHLKSGITAFANAVVYPTVRDPMRLLLEFRADPNDRDSHEKTAYEARVGNMATMIKLIQIARLDVTDDYGEAIIHAAISTPNDDTGGELLQALLQLS
jgi:ankyrin repeat protein